MLEAGAAAGGAQNDRRFLPLLKIEREAMRRKAHVDNRKIDLYNGTGKR